MQVLDLSNFIINMNLPYRLFPTSELLSACYKYQPLFRRLKEKQFTEALVSNGYNKAHYINNDAL